MASLESRKHISPDSEFPVTLHPNFSPKIKDWVPSQPAREENDPGKDGALYADPEKKSLLSAVHRIDLTESIGTLLEGVQLSQLSVQQLDELALLVNERSVFFLCDQDLTTEGQFEQFEHYGTLDRHPAQRDARHVVIRSSREDHRELLKCTPWPSGDFHVDTSFELHPPSYSMLRMEEHPQWAVTPPGCRLVGSRDDLRSLGDWPQPVWTRNTRPSAHTPVTGLKALNINPGFVTGFAELNKVESDKLLDFFAYHIHSADDHYERGEYRHCGIIGHRCAVHRVIPGRYEGNRKGIRMTIFGEKPFLNPESEGRYEREERLKRKPSWDKRMTGSSSGETSSKWRRRREVLP